MNIWPSLPAFVVFVLICFGCSNSDVSISDIKWHCQKGKEKQQCEIEFTLINSIDFPVEAKVLIRAYRRSHIMGSDAIGNEVVGEKRLTVVIEPQDSKEFLEKLDVLGKVTQIVVTASGEKV